MFYSFKHLISDFWTFLAKFRIKLKDFPDWDHPCSINISSWTSHEWSLSGPLWKLLKDFPSIQKTLKIFFSKATGQISKQFGTNGPLVTLYQSFSTLFWLVEKHGHQGVWPVFPMLIKGKLPETKENVVRETTLAVRLSLTYQWLSLLVEKLKRVFSLDSGEEDNRKKFIKWPCPGSQMFYIGLYRKIIKNIFVWNL